MSEKTLICYDKFVKNDSETQILTNKVEGQRNCCIVEGINDAYFFESILLDMDSGYDSSNTVICITHGKERLDKFASAFFINEAFTRGPLRNIAVCFDADENPNKSHEDVLSTLRKHIDGAELTGASPVEKTTDRNIGVFLLPDNEHAGTLETLCIKMIEENEETLSALERCKCLNLPEDRFYQKRLMQAYLATPRRDFCSGVGMGLKKKLLPRYAQHLKRVKAFLSECFESEV